MPNIEVDWHPEPVEKQGGQSSLSARCGLEEARGQAATPRITQPPPPRFLAELINYIDDKWPRLPRGAMKLTKAAPGAGKELSLARAERSS